jgi:hypothetical protein
MDTVAVKAHLQRALLHEESAKRFVADLPHSGWRIVMHFYTALHFLKAHLATKQPPCRPESHVDCQREILRWPELNQGRGSAFRIAYLRLKSVSEQFRYDEKFEVDAEDLDKADRDLRAVRGLLDSKITSALSSEK